MPAATKVSKGTETSAKLNPGSKNRKPTKHQSHRFGRIRREGDEEIIREAQSDYGQSESDKTDEEDSHSESSAVSLPDSHLPSSSQSQPTPGHSNGHDSTLSDASEPGTSTGKPLLDALMEPRLDWSDAVFASEGDVPVIQFGEMGSRDDAEPGDVFGEDETAAADAAQSHRGAPPTFRRHVGMSARQVYLKRLENDPAYTPRVGDFWGHDERLLDKDLRSLSGWWRGKWTGGSRGGMASSSLGDHNHGSSTSPMRGGGSWRGRGGGVTPQAPVDPVDQAWKHDGFEEMKKVEEFQEARSRAVSDAANRGGFGARGRGRGGIMRGSPLIGRVARSNSVATPSPQSPQGPLRPYGHVRAQSTTWNRYEHAWTRHAVTFLFQDALNRPKNGDEIGIRVKLPGQLRFNVVRVSKSTPVASPATENGSTQTPPRTIIVKLPKTAKQETKEQATDPENVRTVSSPPLPEEVVSAIPTIALPTVTTTAPAEKEHPAPANEIPVTDNAAPSVEQNMSSEPPRMEQPTQLPPREVPSLQLLTNFSESTPSPAYSSPSFGPGYYHPVPRPSVAYPPQSMVNSDQPMWHDPRMPYGYPTPPPLPGHQMYTPPQAARHVHHHSYSASHPHHHMPQQQSGVPPYYGQQPVPIQEYHQPPHVDYGQSSASQPDRRSQPAFTYGSDGAMIDVQTGTPIFSLAKSATKVAIRRPGDTDEASAQQQQHESAGGNSTSNEAPESSAAKDATAAANSAHYGQQSRPEMAMPPQSFVPGHAHGHPSQQFWNGYPQAPNGYYYQQPMYGVPQPQEYGYGQQMQGQAPPMHGYPQPHYGDGMEYQPHVYY